MKRAAWVILFQCGLGLAWMPAQNGPPPPPEPDSTVPPPPPPEHPPHSGPHGPIPGGPPHSGWHERGEMYKQLSESERQKVREAFDKVWNRPEVAAAREKLTQANEEYRTTMQRALQEADPEVVKILEKVKPPGPPGSNLANVRMPEPEDPEFASKALGRLGSELQGFHGPDHREGRDGVGLRLHERVLQTATVREAIKQLQEAHGPAERVEAWRRLRDAYIAAVKQLNSPGPRPGPPEPGSGPQPEKR